MQTSSALPFSLEAEAISKWVDTLALNNPVQASNDIYLVIRTLSKHQEKFQAHIELILNELTPIAIQLNIDLEPLFTSEIGVLDGKKRKIARLSINLLRHHALLYFHLSKVLTKEPANLAINRCIQIVGLCLKQSALIYDVPSRELWEIIGKLYHLAGSKGLFDTSIDDRFSFFKKQVYIINNIKAVLLFSLCQANYLKQKEIEDLYLLVQQHSQHLVLTNLYSAHCLYFWSYDQPITIQSITPHSQFPSNAVFIDTSLITPILQTNNFSFLVDKLTKHQAFIPSLLKAPPKKSKIAYGFTDVVCFIEKHTQKENSHKASIRSYVDAKNLELQPFEYETKSLKKVSASDIWQEKKKPELEMTTVIMKESHKLGFALIELHDFTGRTEELIISSDNRNRPLLSIIRNVATDTINHNNYQLLIENFSSNAKVTSVSNQHFTGTAILCKVNTDLNFLLTSPKYKFLTGSVIEVGKKTALLSKLLENAPGFIMYQLDWQPHEAHER